MSDEATTDRCRGCGKVLDAGTRVYLILRGTLSENSFHEDEEQGEFGYLHEGCFRRAIESPQSVLEEIRSIARAAKTPS